jgi:hypothetical protein
MSRVRSGNVARLIHLDQVAALNLLIRSVSPFILAKYPASWKGGIPIGAKKGRLGKKYHIFSHFFI